MSRQHKLTPETILDFYFRRLKRILPTFLMVINVILIFSILFSPQSGYKNILAEIIPSSFFYYNWAKIPAISYFDTQSKFLILLHTWSLSCEIQFYLIFPLVFACLIASDRIHKRLKFVFILIVIICSFVIQTTTLEMQGRHMIFSGRLWQFFLGFVSHFVYESEIKCEF